MRLLIYSALFSFALPAFAAFCAHWEAGKELGTLSPRDLREVSGMAASKAYPDRIYWVNDSGNSAAFFYTNSSGKNVVRVKIDPLKPRDVEAMALTECPEGPCIALGDIGDNSWKRDFIRVYFVLEQNQFGESVSVKRELKLEYPDGAHDAEAMAFTPSGDLILVTKEFRMNFRKQIPPLTANVRPAQVYSVAHADWVKADPAKAVKLKKIGEIPVAKIVPEAFFLSHIVTDLAFSARRQVFALLTYTHAIEIPLSKMKELSSAAEWKKDRDYSILPLEALNQQESVTYSPEVDRILWSSEYMPPATPIFSMTCTRTVP